MPDVILRANIRERLAGRQIERMEEGTPFGGVDLEVPQGLAVAQHLDARRGLLQLRATEDRDGIVRTAALRHTRDQLVQQIADRPLGRIEAFLADRFRQAEVAALFVRHPRARAVVADFVRSPFGVEEAVRRVALAENVEAAADGCEDGHLVPGGMSFRHAALAGAARRQAFREDVLHRVAEGVFGLGDTTARIDIRTVVPVREDDGRGPLLDGDPRRRHVADDVVLPLVRMAAAHQIPALHLLGDQPASVQLRVAIGLGFEQAAHVGEKAHRADDHAPVGRGGERLAIDVGRVRRIVGIGVLHPFGVGGGEIDVLLVSLGVAALGNDNDANVLRTAHGDVGATIEGVEDFHGGDG